MSFMNESRDSFPFDIWIQILGYLSAQDIIRYRTVNRLLLEASKKRSLWIQVFLEAKHPIPDIDPHTIPIPKLEKMLVSASIMIDVWSNTSGYELKPIWTKDSTLEGFYWDFYEDQHESNSLRWICKRNPKEGIYTGPCWLISPHVITLSYSGTHYALEYCMENELDPIFTYNIPRNCYHGVNIDPIKKVSYLAYIFPEESYLKIVSVEYDEESQCFNTMEYSHDLSDIPLEWGMPTIDTVQHDCVVLELTNRRTGFYDGDDRIVIHITTGRRMGFRVAYDFTEENPPTYTFTTHHLIVVHEEQYFFYEWPNSSSPTQLTPLVGEWLSPKPNHAITLYDNRENLCFLPLSTTSYVLITTGYKGTRFYVLDLDPGTESITIRNGPKPLPVEWPGEVTFSSGLSPHSKSFLGVTAITSGGLFLLRVEEISSPQSDLELIFEVKQWKQPFFTTNYDSYGRQYWRIEALDVFSRRIMLVNGMERCFVVKFCSIDPDILNRGRLYALYGI